MNRNNRNSKPLGHLAIAIALGLIATAPVRAADERPIASTEYEMAQWASYEQPRDTGLTRADVRDSLRMSRLLGLVSPGGEGSESEDLLLARETFNALQTEVYAAEAVRVNVDTALVVD